MKKFLCVVLSLLVLSSLVLFGGCSKKDAFSGNYKEVDKSDVIDVINYFTEREENLIDWSNGVHITAFQKSNAYEMTMESKIVSSVFDSAKGVCETSIKIKSEGRTEKTKIVYDGVYMYKEVELAGTSQKTKGRVAFNQVYDFTDLDDFDDSIGEALSIAVEEEYTTKFYLDKGEDKTKLKIESYYLEIGYGEETVVGYFIFDKFYNLQAVKMEMTASYGDNESEMEVVIEKWSGKISAPSNAEDYYEVDDILD